MGSQKRRSVLVHILFLLDEEKLELVWILRILIRFSTVKTQNFLCNYEEMGISSRVSTD